MAHDSGINDGRAFDTDDAPAAAELHRVLRARASAMASPLPGDTGAEFVDLVVFRVGGERYAIDAVEVREAITVAKVTALPGVAAFYRGLISHQGTVYPLLDIRSLVNATADSETPPAEAILIAFEGCTIAICAEAVESFVHIETSAIAETPASDDGVRATAIRGMTNDGIVVIDIRMLLADARLVVDDRTPISDKSLKGTT